MSVMPISIKNDPIMGTSDGGGHVYADNDKLMRIVKECADVLHLSEHLVGGKVLYLGCDVEGHLSNDGKSYCLLDFARVFPPEHPFRTDHLPSHRVLLPNGLLSVTSIFYRLLRPEFVR